MELYGPLIITDSLLRKDVKRLWPIYTVQTSNMPYAVRFRSTSVWEGFVS